MAFDGLGDASAVSSQFLHDQGRKLLKLEIAEPNQERIHVHGVCSDAASNAGQCGRGCAGEGIKNQLVRLRGLQNFVDHMQRVRRSQSEPAVSSAFDVAAKREMRLLSPVVSSGEVSQIFFREFRRHDSSASMTVSTSVRMRAEFRVKKPAKS